jgi:HAE1 family hydrophobic/amphiphilic exporter-1
MLITLPTGGTVRLNEVADVALATQDSDSIAKVDGSACVILQITKQSGANEVAASEAVLERLDELQAENPNVRYTVPYIASDYINLSVDIRLPEHSPGRAAGRHRGAFLFLRRAAPP